MKTGNKVEEAYEAIKEEPELAWGLAIVTASASSRDSALTNYVNTLQKQPVGEDLTLAVLDGGASTSCVPDDSCFIKESIQKTPGAVIKQYTGPAEVKAKGTAIVLMRSRISRG
jgi:hypothetical protein